MYSLSSLGHYLRYLLVLLEDMAGLTIQGQFLRFLLGIHRSYGWPYQTSSALASPSDTCLESKVDMIGLTSHLLVLALFLVLSSILGSRFIPGSGYIFWFWLT